MSAKIIALGSTKGGVGKTTLAVQLAIARARQGKKVWLVDGDPQATAMKAMGLRAAAELQPFVACTAYTDPKELMSKVLENRDRWDTIIIDVSGYDSLSLRAAMSICDKLICPLQPRTYDIWTATDILRVVKECNVYRQNELTLNVVLNRIDCQESSDNAASAEVLTPIEGINLMNTRIGQRKAYPNSSGVGMGVEEYGKDKKAISEIESFVAELFNEPETKNEEA